MLWNAEIPLSVEPWTYFFELHQFFVWVPLQSRIALIAIFVRMFEQFHCASFVTVALKAASLHVNMTGIRDSPTSKYYRIHSLR
jgi:hypothetical protein